MQSNDQKQAFLRIAKASIVNILGFGFATVLIDYLAKQTDIGTPVMVLALIVAFVIFVSISSLFLFIFHTVKAIPSTMAAQATNVKFLDIYGYILTALSIRIVEAAICIAYVIYIHRIFYK